MNLLQTPCFRDKKSRFLALSLACAVVCIFLVNRPVSAQETQEQPPLPQDSLAALDDPFGALSGSWVKIQDYETDKIKPPQPETLMPIKETAPTKLEADKALPERTLNLSTRPSLPNSLISSVLPSNDGNDDLFYGGKRWMKFDEAEEAAAQQAAAEQLLRDAGKSPFKVRFAALPNKQVQSVFAGRVLKTEETPESKPTPKKPSLSPEKQKTVTEECKVLTDYRRRQLEAIESDRQTLSALKDALSDLGLSQKLSFMAHPDETASLASEGISKAVNVNMEKK